MKQTAIYMSLALAIFFVIACSPSFSLLTDPVNANDNYQQGTAADHSKKEKKEFQDVAGFKHLGGGFYQYSESQKKTPHKKGGGKNKKITATVIGFYKLEQIVDGEILILKTGDEYISAVFSIPNLRNIKSEKDIPDFDYKIGDKLKITGDWFYFYGIKHYTVSAFSKVN